MRQAHSEGVATHDKAIAAIERDSRAFGDDDDDGDDGTQVQYERPTRGAVVRALSNAYIVRCYVCLFVLQCWTSIGISPTVVVPPTAAKCFPSHKYAVSTGKKCGSVVSEKKHQPQTHCGLGPLAGLCPRRCTFLLLPRSHVRSNTPPPSLPSFLCLTARLCWKRVAKTSLDNFVVNEMYFPVYTPLAYVPRGVLE